MCIRDSPPPSPPHPTRAPPPPRARSTERPPHARPLTGAAPARARAAARSKQDVQGHPREVQAGRER
eukprot:7390570-Prymnesium_polylepis.1